METSSVCEGKNSFSYWKVAQTGHK